MKRTIYKYPLQFEPRQQVRMPADAGLLSVEMQRGDICIWAMVDLERDLEPRTFILAATGEEFDADGLFYVGTVQPSERLVFHLFEAIL